MYVIRNTFIAKPGHAKELAKLMKESAPPGMQETSTVMLDFATDFNTIVLEYRTESLAEFEKMMNDFKTNDATRKPMTGYTDLYMTGKREIFVTVD